MTVNIINERLDKVLDILRKQTDIEFYVDGSVIDQSICADFHNLSIGRGIKKMLEGTGINYAVIAKNGETKAIFIGGSQKPEPFSGKLDARSTIPWRKQPINRSTNIVQPAGNKVLPQSGKQKPPHQEKPAVNIPTAGSLSTAPDPKNKHQKE